jgi:hypothetical protein
MDLRIGHRIGAGRPFEIVGDRGFNLTDMFHYTVYVIIYTIAIFVLSF